MGLLQNSVLPLNLIPRLVHPQSNQGEVRPVDFDEVEEQLNLGVAPFVG